MKWSHPLITAAGLVGLSAAVAFAQQDRPGAAEQDQPVEAAATQEAAETQAEPRSDAEVLADHRAAHIARIEARKQANEGIESQWQPQPEIRYHPAW